MFRLPAVAPRKVCSERPSLRHVQRHVRLDYVALRPAFWQSQRTMPEARIQASLSPDERICLLASIRLADVAASPLRSWRAALARRSQGIATSERSRLRSAGQRSKQQASVQTKYPYLRHFPLVAEILPQDNRTAGEAGANIASRFQNHRGKQSRPGKLPCKEYRGH